METTASSGRSRENVSSQNTSAVSDEAGQPSTTWSGLKLSFATPLSESSMPSPCSSTSKRCMTRHGGMALCGTCTTWVSEGVYPSSSPAFFQTDTFGFGSALSFPTHTTRSWGCPRAASSLSPFLALRSTALQTPSPEVCPVACTCATVAKTWPPLGDSSNVASLKSTIGQWQTGLSFQS